MNLEDFKSFCRVLIPSEVGSIPTHSRQSGSRPAEKGSDRTAGAGALAGVLFALATGSALAQAPGEEGEGIPAGPVIVTEAPDLTPGPLTRAFRSVAFPAWGQLTNRKPGKAVVLFSVQTYLYTRLVLETRRAREARRRADRLTAGGSTDPVVLAQIEAAETSAQDHFDRRRDLVFWAVIGGFFGAMDAYIDAHLGDFEEDLEDDRTLFGGIDPSRGTVELGMRF